MRLTQKTTTTRAARIAGATAAMTLLFLPTMASALPPTPSHGTFVDGGGGRHPWTINSAHTLLWDDKPFLPVGGLFQVQSWGPNATDADFAADKAALTEIKAKGVTDIIVQPARGGITAISPESLQRLFNFLDAEGFTYGISLNDGPREPLSAFEVRPGAYRQMTPRGGGVPLRFPAENLASSLYFIVAPAGSEIVTSGLAQMIPDGAKIDTPPLESQMVAFLIPEKLYFSNSPMGVPNLWDGYDSYRDSLLGLFAKVKLGKGFRFFVDPLPPTLDLSDEALRLIPDSSGFTSEWGAYLARKYRTLQALDAAWNISDISDRDLPSFNAVAGLMPLWNGGKGVSLFYNRKTQKAIKTDYTRSLFWTDLRAFMTESVRGYMNDLAIALKQGVAEVPVVYRSHKTSPLFSRLPGGVGFDGIGIDTYGRGRELISTGGAGEVYAQASEAERTMWLPVTATSDAGPAPSAKTTKGYTSRIALQGDFNWLRDIGGRGFYVDSLRTLDPARANFNLSGSAEQLTWLSEYRGMLEVGARSGGPLTTLPGVTYYPRSLAGGTIRLLTGGEWWLPTERPYLLYEFGTSGSAYALTETDGSTTYYLWNPSGETKTIRLQLPPQTTKLKDAPKVQWSASANGTVKKDVLTLTIGPDPIRLINYPTVPLPIDAFDESYKEALKMAAIMKDRDSLERGLLSNINLPQLRMLKQKRDPWYAYAQLQDNLVRMRSVIRGYAWLQAEGDEIQTPTDQSFDAVEEKAGASNGRVLVVGKRAPGMTASARYSVTVNAAGTFDLWVGASPNAPLTFRIDDQPILNEAARPVNLPGATYAGGDLTWINFGPVTLPAGRHILEVRATGPAIVDTILLHRGNFIPNGPNPPAVVP